MSSLSRISKLKLGQLGQFGHSIRTNATVVKTVEQCTHHTSESSINLWKNLSVFGCFPVIMLGFYNAFCTEHEHHRPEPIEYEYLKIIRKRFPWRDGKRSLFHNPKVNWIPGEGYTDQ